jgi:hypothetical protein
MTANKEPKQKHKRPEKHAQQHAELGQKKARLEKEKEAQLSAMGQTSHGPERPEEVGRKRRRVRKCVPSPDRATQIILSATRKFPSG